MSYTKNPAPKPTKKQLEALYNQPLALRQVAKITGGSLAVIHRLMIDYGIPRRSHSEGLRISLSTEAVQVKMRHAKMREGFSAKRIGTLSEQIRVCIRPLRKKLLLHAICHQCQSSQAEQVHHVTPLGALVTDMLTKGLNDLDVVVQLVAEHYAGKITLIPLCIACHKCQHSKTT